MWSEQAFTGNSESPAAMHMPKVLEVLKTKVEASKAVNVVAIIKEGLNSRELVRSVKNL
jgi:hypothetical protein